MNTNDQIVLGDWMWEKTKNGYWSRWWRLPRTDEFTYEGLSESA